MKKLFMLATSAMLFTGAFAHDGKKGCKGKDCCKKGHKTEAAKTVKTTTATTKKA